MYKTFKELKEIYGESIAIDIRARKKAAELQRQPGDGEEPFWREHFEVKDDEAGNFSKLLILVAIIFMSIHVQC